MYQIIAAMNQLPLLEISLRINGVEGLQKEKCVQTRPQGENLSKFFVIFTILFHCHALRSSQCDGA